MFKQQDKPQGPGAEYHQFYLPLKLRHSRYVRQASAKYQWKAGKNIKTECQFGQEPTYLCCIKTTKMIKVNYIINLYGFN